jgi:hypothetical protein
MVYSKICHEDLNFVRTGQLKHQLYTEPNLILIKFLKTDDIKISVLRFVTHTSRLWYSSFLKQTVRKQ